MTDYVDAYCERIDPGRWGEPANAVSNLAFLLAAALLGWLQAGQRHRAPVSVRLLPALLAVVGLASLAFHTAATRLTGALDSLAIIAFILTAVVVLARWTWGIRWRWAWLAAPAYLGFAVGVNAALAAVGGTDATLGGYLPALLGLVGLGVAVRYTARPPAPRVAGLLLRAAAVFALSLTLRTLDEPLCGQFPVGSHFLWHILNAVVLFLVGYAITQRQQQVGRGG
ncbi:ceramidase domain-containing protein [Solwaraspora sp. WMMD1047]|uniref:ceramidase domain-containing protein n=1 Tax=Solwaraspora sp. WMMD1047 TaxID=3016102 RepID=UPI002416A0BE|nr:ceramidase domain-containing protein [Solwaraspora sp. WMMD1047]MDG4833403.1 ceramidase domain-containing protein [Solwaraspora sp. WMMD1047]